MTSDSSRKPAGALPAGELPPVEPPTMGFILQLFVIPMVIVSIIVVIWLLFNWLAHMGTNPTELVRDLKKMNDVSWQKALTLADLLRNPRNAALKKDEELAREVGAVLDDQITAARMEDNPVQLRVFLCRALGEFQVPDVLPTLLRAAATQRAEPEVQVRRSAVQALAIYIDRNGSAQLRDNSQLVDVLLSASRERSESDPDNSLAELRSTAAFALGMLGGDRAMERLALMLDDGYPNARYNAALGMCRHGDKRALPVLLEMLDPNNEESVRHEAFDQGKPWKRLLVMQNGIRAAGQLVAADSSGDLSPLVEALEHVKQADLAKFDPGTRRGVQMEAEEVLLRLRQPGAVR